MYTEGAEPEHKPLTWLHGEIKTPPFSRDARIEAGTLLRLLQAGESLGMPHSRPMPSIGARCHELRVNDRDHDWRIVYRVDDDAILILDVFPKTTRATPRSAIERCQSRFQQYDRVVEEAARTRARSKKKGR